MYQLLPQPHETNNFYACDVRQCLSVCKSFAYYVTVAESFKSQYNTSNSFITFFFFFPFNDKITEIDILRLHIQCRQHLVSI